MIKKIKDDKNPFLFRLEYEDKGYLEYSVLYDKIEIENIFVSEDFRKQGIAIKLMDYLILEANQAKIINITLEVKKDNIPAINLYKKYGFKEVAIRENYYNGTDGILMIKKLGSD